MPENQTAWNSDNHEIKETVKQNNQTCKVADGEKPRWGSGQWDHGVQAGCSEAGGADLRGNWDSELTVDYGSCQVMGETPILTWEFIEKCSRDEQVSCIVLSLAPPTQAAPQHSKEGCPAHMTT